MNITTRLSQISNSTRTIGNKSKFVLSLNIDIPIKSKIRKDKESSISYKNNSQRVQVSMIPNRDYSINLLNNIDTYRNKKKLQDQILFKRKSNNSRPKFQSCQIFPKKLRKNSLIKTHRQFQMIEDIDSENSLIKFTHQSSSPQLQPVIPYFFTDRIDIDLNLDEIRKFQHIAHQKKEYINYQYLKEQFLILASAKKIQRAWRKYRTTKIIKSYSNAFSNLNNPDEKYKVKRIKQRSVFHGSQSECRQVNKIKQKTCSLQDKQDQKSVQEVKLPLLNEFESEEIKKWDELIQQIRSGKSLEEVLEKSYQRKQQLQEQLMSYLVNQRASGATNNHLIQQQQIQKIHYQDQYQQSSVSSSLSNIQKEKYENQRLKKQLLDLRKIEQEYSKTQQPYLSLNRCREEIVLHKIEKPKSAQLQDYFINLQEKGSLESTGPQKNKQPLNIVKNRIKQFNTLFLQEKIQFCNYLTEQLIIESLIDFSQSQSIVANFKPLIDNLEKFRQVQEKTQGICTNLESIKDYLQNLVSFTFDFHLADALESLNKPCGLSAIQLLQYIRNSQHFIIAPVLSQQMFEEHWKFVSDQIYFDRKQKDEQKEQKRIIHLKNLTKIYFRLVFDAFNQSLEFQRVYGVQGQPYPWKNSPIFKKFNSDAKIYMKLAYRRIMSLSTIYCGLHLDTKGTNVPQSVMVEVQQQRMNNLLIMQTTQQDYKWNKLDEKQVSVLLDISEWAQYMLLSDLILDLQQFT